jgi:hypothetical protein
MNSPSANNGLDDWCHWLMRALVLGTAPPMCWIDGNQCGAPTKLLAADAGDMAAARHSHCDRRGESTFKESALRTVANLTKIAPVMQMLITAVDGRKARQGSESFW